MDEVRFLNPRLLPPVPTTLSLPAKMKRGNQKIQPFRTNSIPMESMHLRQMGTEVLIDRALIKMIVVAHRWRGGWWRETGPVPLEQVFKLMRIKLTRFAIIGPGIVQGTQVRPRTARKRRRDER